MERSARFRRQSSTPMEIRRARFSTVLQQRTGTSACRKPSIFIASAGLPSGSMRSIHSTLRTSLLQTQPWARLRPAKSPEPSTTIATCRDRSHCIFDSAVAWFPISALILRDRSDEQRGYLTEPRGIGRPDSTIGHDHVAFIEGAEPIDGFHSDLAAVDDQNPLLAGTKKSLRHLGIVVHDAFLKRQCSCAEEDFVGIDGAQGIEHGIPREIVTAAAINATGEHNLDAGTAR